MRRIRSNPSQGFTLVELLVVIGIVAALIGILLPVLSTVQSRARDLQCQSNIHQIVQLVLNYASDNKGQLPYGSYYVSGGGAPQGWGPVDLNAGSIHLWSIVSHMASPTYSIEDNSAAPMKQRPAFLRCLEALQVQPHLCSYVGSLTAFLTPSIDAGSASNAPDAEPWMRLVEKPTKVTQCLSFTALIWETNVTSGMANHIGWIVGWDIDGLRMSYLGAVVPQYRYYSLNDPFAQVPPGIYGNNKPVRLYPQWRNIDPPVQDVEGLSPGGYIGNPRFRHNKNTTCNVGFADGHVGRFTGKFKRDGSVISHDALRKCFMVKWPTGIAPDPSLPH